MSTDCRFSSVRSVDEVSNDGAGADNLLNMKCGWRCGYRQLPKFVVRVRVRVRSFLKTIGAGADSAPALALRGMVWTNHGRKVTLENEVSHKQNKKIKPLRNPL